ncbi:DUF4373 domain-containing protein [bacterium]|nr:DUF4373 domain-containing protein [bacterium]
MARTIKKGLDYFPFDVDFFQDIRIRKLIKYQGGKAVTVYALLLCTIYKNGYYAEWDKELPFIISEQSGYTEAYIQEVIDCCMNIGLLSKELFESAKVLTSKGIQERYRNICKASRRSGMIKEYNLLSAEEQEAQAPNPQPPEVNRHNPAPASFKKETKPNPKPKTIPEAPAPAPSAPPKYISNIEEEVAEMKRSVQWKESVCIRFNIDTEKVDFFLSDFALKCNKQHNSMQDARSHFCYWLQEQIQKPTQYKSKPTPTNNSNTYEYKGGFGGKDQ